MVSGKSIGFRADGRQIAHPTPDLSEAQNARDFLATLVIDNRKVEWVEFSNGDRSYFHELTDSEAISIAKNLFFSLFIGEIQSGPH